MSVYSSLIRQLEFLEQTVASGRFVRGQLGKPTAAAADLKSVDLRPILVKRQVKLSFTYHYKTRDIVKNYEAAEARKVAAELLNGTFESGKFLTLDGDYALVRKGPVYNVSRQEATQAEAPDMAHDRKKTRLLEGAGKPYLHALGVTDAEGEVLKSAQDKFRQINKYIEILDGLIAPLPRDLPLKVVDMGSGKGYLTFALYDHLTATMKRKAEVVGVEYRADMVALCNRIAKENGFAGLGFVQGTIADYDCTGATVVIALHACDTATDDALAKGIKAGAKLLVVAPCCHKEVRKQLKADDGHALKFLLRYGTYAERIAEMVTDGLRALLLEMCGYSVNVFEFIGGEHTPKNVMIVASFAGAPKREAVAALKAKVVEAKAMFGLTRQRLEELVG